MYGRGGMARCIKFNNVADIVNNISRSRITQRSAKLAIQQANTMAAAYVAGPEVNNISNSFNQ